ncbi:MAG TPA: SBBP repeat-containing protein, partial [Pyrinomonadaceae bacterium]
MFAVALLASPFLFLERGAHVSESARAVSRRETLSRGAEGRGAAARPDALAQVDPATRARLTEAYGQLPMRFEANRGQTDAAVKFVARGQGYALFLTPTEAVLSLRQAGGREESAADAGGPEGASQAGAAEESPSPSAASSPSGAVLRVGLVGANPAPALEGVEELSGRSNYFVGADERGWVTDVAGFGAVKYESVYPGVDLVYYGQQRQLEYDFRLDAGADPARIALHFEGAQTVALGAGGDLVLGTEVGEVRQRRPFIYQEIDGARREVAGGYKLLGENRVAFEVGEYDQSRPLVIDPVLVYSTYLGGNDSDAGFGVAVDAAGNAYVAGDTFSTDFPGPSPIQAAKDVSFDAFVLKLNPTGSGLVYATYLGGNGDDFGNAVAVDPAGNAYVVGYTTSDIFPLTAGALQQSRLGVIDGYVAKLNPTGSALVYSTLLGGNNNDEVLAVAADAAGNAYVAGYTDSSEIASAGVFDMRAGSPIYRSADGGGSWAEADNGFTASRVNFFAAHPTDAATIYAGAASGVFKTTDGGNLWSLTGAAQPSTLPRFVNWVAVHPTTPETVYAATFAGAYKSTDGGQTYEEKNTGLFDQNLLTIVIDPATPTTLYAGSFFGANKSTNGGDNWTQINNGLRAASFSFEPQVFDLVIDPTNPSVLYAGTSQGIFKTTNGGANWAPLNTGLGSAFTPPSVTTLLIDPQNPATLYAAVTVFGGNQLLKTTNGGGEWNVVGAGLRTTIGATTFTPRIDALAIDPANSSVLYAGTLGSGVFKSTDGGANWAQASAGLNNNSVGAIVVDRAVPSHVFAGTNIGSDAFAGKINPEGTAVVHFRFLGGNENDMATGVVADPAGNAYITGHTASNNFPVLGALQPAKGGGTDAFLTKLNPSGAGLVYSTYLGGFANDEARAVALGPAGSAYLTGRTQSTNFPLASPLKFSPPSFIDDAFVSRISADGTTLLYSTYLGGDSGTEQGFGIAVDAAGNAHVTGLTSSNDFPLVGAVQTTRGGGNDAFVSKLNPSGTALAFSTYHGGAGNDVGNAVAVDAAGNTYFVGATNSFNLPLAAPFQNAYRGGGDAFIAKLGSSIELAVAMTDSPDPVAFGSNLTYILTVSNNGELSAAGVTLTDTLPAGATFVSATPGQGSCSGTTTVTCNLGTLNGGAATTVAIVVLPPAVRNISNTASVTSNEADPLPANNTATESTQVNFADLSVTGAASYGKVAPGARINYLFRVANNSGGPAESATLSGNLPAGTTFVSCGAVGGVCSNSGGSWAVTFPSLAVGQSAAVVLVAAVDAAVAEGAVLGHTATAAAAATPDPDAGNNSAAVTVTVTATPLRVKTNGLIAFASDGVHTVKADASAPPAPFPGAEGGIFPRWSPDGTRLAYTVQKRQPTYPNDAYYVIEAANADGSGRLTLADNVIDTSFDNRSGFSWSPDGTRLAYVGTDRLIYLANADGSGYAKLPGSPTQVRDVDWSPDGSRFVFSKDFGEIYVMNVDGSGLSKLVAFGTGPDGPTHYLSPLWSPDMTKILFVQRSNNFTDILFMRSDGTGAQRLLNRGQTSGPAWSPDGKRIAFYHGTEMHVVDFDGTDELTLVTNQSCCGFGGTSWQPIPTDAPL